MKEMKKVSILIPLYNCEKFVTDTLNCCLRQTYSNVEVIIVDDGSTDNSYKIAKSYESDKIHVYHQENAGGCSARNKAFELCTGDYIMYLDADDIISDDKIEMQMDRLIHASDTTTVATCPYEEFYENTTHLEFNPRIIYKDYACGLDLLEDEWANNECFTVTCFLVPRKLIEEIGPWNLSLTKNQDGEYFCRILSKAGPIVYCPDSKFYYRRGHASVSTINRLKPEHIKSSLESRIVYQNTVLPLRDTARIREGLARCFATVMLNAIYGSDYYNEARNRILNLRLKPRHPSPSKAVFLLQNVIGFERVLWLKQQLYNLHHKNSH